MRLCLTVVALVACTKPNPEYCDDTRPCLSGYVCNTLHTCVQAEDSVDAGSPVSPTIVSISPANNARAVKPEQSIIVTFSKPMDQPSVESAWISADVPANSVTFLWNETGDRVTVDPIGLLPHATGTGLTPANTPTTVFYSIAATARDTEGTALKAPINGQFSTIRRFTHDVGVIDALTQAVVNDSTVVEPATAFAGDSQFTDVYVRMFVSFALPALPAGSQLHEAQFRAPVNGTAGSPFLKLGILSLHQVSFGTFSSGSFNTQPITMLGELTNNGTPETKIRVVTAAVADDYTNAGSRGGRSQYRIQFAVGTNNDGTTDQIGFVRTGFGLRLIYDVE